MRCSNSGVAWVLVALRGSKKCRPIFDEVNYKCRVKNPLLLDTAKILSFSVKSNQPLQPAALHVPHTPCNATVLQSLKIALQKAKLDLFSLINSHFIIHGKIYTSNREMCHLLNYFHLLCFSKELILAQAINIRNNV